MSTRPVPAAPKPPLWRRLAPFVFALALLAFVLRQLRFGAFVDALAKIDYVTFFACAIVYCVTLLLADAAATRLLYRLTVCPIPYWDLVTLRGASYLPQLVHYHVGQGWLTYFLSKVYKAKLWRVAGATLFGYVTTFGALTFIGLAALPLARDRIPWLAPTAMGVAGAGVVYLVVIALRPRALANRTATAPLIEAGVIGHLHVLLYRLPHMAILFLGSYVPFLIFGVDIPLGEALALIPPLLLVVGLPITPQGVGAREALAVELFAEYAPGDRPEQVATIVACTLAWAVTTTLIQLVISPPLMRRAYKILRRNEAQQAATAESATSA